MKTLLSIIIITFISLSIHAGNSVNPKNDNHKTVSPYFFNNINILSIKKDVDSNNRAYLMTGSFTITKSPRKNQDVSHTVDVSFRNSLILSRKGSNYIQANAQAKRNDNNSNNEFRIYVHHDQYGKGKIDKKNIKVNWKTGSAEIVNKLSNVSVIYQKDSILIVGTMQKNGYTIGVNLAIVKDTKLI